MELRNLESGVQKLEVDAASTRAAKSTTLRPDELWKLLIAIGLHNHYNLNLREFIWYGLWTYALMSFTTITSCFVYPQYPIWAFSDLNDGASVIMTHSPSASGPPSSIRQLFEPEVSGEAIKELPFPSTVPPGENPTTPTRETSEMLVPSAPKLLSERSLGQFPHTKIPSPSVDTVKQLSAIFSSMTQRAQKLESQIEQRDRRFNKRIIIPNTHRVPDFGVIHIKHVLDHTVVFPHVKILGVIVPVLLEVKNYRCHENDHDCLASQLERAGQLQNAISSITEQVSYLMTSGAQSAVIGIITSGHYWGWQHFIKKDNEIIGKEYPETSVRRMAVADIPADSSKGEWFGVFVYGTEESTTMLSKIHSWATSFIMDSDCNNIDLDLDI